MRPPPLMRASARSRRGAVIVMFALLVFAFFAIAGIAIDVGMASWTQQSMQVAVDPASMEGVRLRDYNTYQHYSDPRRRPRVSNLVRLVFDDDLRPTLGTPASTALNVAAVPADDADALQLGAGPMLRVSGQSDGDMAAGGVTGWQAPPTPAGAPATPTWDDPVLQGNQLPDGTVGNFEWGDMLSGTFYPNEPRDETPSYQRADFIRGATDITLGSREAIGFLVRMRRTPSAANGFDNAPGKASRGPTVAFLWGLGSLMRKDPSSAWDPRRQGITVRATAIAVARPALRASPAPVNSLTGLPIISESDAPDAPMLGLHPIALSLDYWASLNPGSSWNPTENTMTIGSGGALVMGGQIRGRVVRPRGVTSVGLPVISDLTDFAALPAGSRPGFVAIYATVFNSAGGPIERVIGYGFADADKDNPGELVVRQGILAPAGGSTGQVRVWVGANGVSSNIGYETPHLTADEWVSVFAHNRTLAFGGDNNPGFAVTYDHTRIRTGSLLAPALAR